VPMPVMQVRGMGVVVFHLFVKMNVGVRAIRQRDIHRMKMLVVFVGMCVPVVMFHRLVRMMVVMVFGQHQPGAGQHDRQRAPEQDGRHFIQ
jgi:hypothetical protein